MLHINLATAITTPLVILLLWLTIREWRIISQLRSNGIRIQAVIQSKFTAIDNRNNCSIKYVYTVNQQHYNNVQKISLSLYNKSYNEDEIEIIYSKRCPEISRLPDNIKLTEMIWYVFTLVLFTVTLLMSMFVLH